MTRINITRVKCNGCPTVIDDNDIRNHRWLALDVKTPDEDGMSVKSLDLCKTCAEHLAKRLAEIGIIL
jgi:hypothetical protein